MNYVKFIGDPTISEDCTTRWNDSVICKIVLSGTLNGSFYNLMRMDGDITQWLSDNSAKVTQITKSEMDSLGQQIVPMGTEVTTIDPSTSQTVRYIATVFNADDSEALWVEL